MAVNYKKGVGLPSTCVELRNYISEFGDAQTLSSKRLDEFPPSLQKVIKYCGFALKSGRPLNKAMIVLCGESGVGKSSTIKALFNDEGCFADIEASETLQVTEYGKELCVTMEDPPVKGMLSFVDLPGSIHSNSRTEVQNLAAIDEFRKSHPDLEARSSMPDIEKLWSLIVKEQIYPNAVLFTVKATDNRMVGPDSNLRKNLRVLKEFRFLDEQCVNLVVVVTHAMSLPSRTESFIAKSTEITRIIRTAVYEVLKIVDAKVVFVENKPENYDMDKQKGRDFYTLPDGQLSHYNLLQAMVDNFEANEDLLGSLLCGWYFMNDRCTEKKYTKTTVLRQFKPNAIDNEDMTKSQEFLDTLTISNTKSLSESVPTFEFQNIGRGYCPRTEGLRNVVVFRPTETTIVEVFGKNYVLPQKIRLTFLEEDELTYVLTQDTKDQYENKRIDSYGIANDCENLDVCTDNAGRWVKNINGQHNSKVIFLYEKHLIKVALDEPKSMVKKELLDIISQLPAHYNVETCHLFNEFFSKWGSHFIHEEWLGGCIEVEWDVNGNTYKNTEGFDYLKDLRLFFESCKSSEKAGGMSIAIPVHDNMISVVGGDNSDMNTLNNITPDRFVNWLKSLKSNPTELTYTCRLYPYYNLVEGPQHDSLKEATKDYLAAENQQKVPSRRPKFSVRRNQSGWQIVNRIITLKNWFSCFPPFAKVYTKQGVMKIGEITSGVEMLTVSSSGNSNTALVEPTKFCTYLHYDPEKTVEFVVLQAENGYSLTVTGDHLIYHCRNGIPEAIRAKRAKVGDILLYIDGQKRLKQVSISKISTTLVKGVYSPLTSAGTLIVDGFFVSCYAHVDSHSMAHASMMPLRAWHKATHTFTELMMALVGQKAISISLLQPGQLQTDSRIHTYAQFLLYLCRRFSFDKLLSIN